MKLAIASGKGGTGKSTIATNLSYLLSKEFEDVVLIDCDVEEPNCHIFIKPVIESSKKAYSPIPKIDNNKCSACGKCVKICQFNSLALINKEVLVFPELCHGCGACWLVCPEHAIEESKKEIGVVEKGKAKKLNFVHGKSRIGEPMSPPLIRETKKAGAEHKIQILDCPPGTSCPVINAVEGADFVIMVTEPTPFGLYDLKLAVDVIRKLKKDFAILINRSGENDKLIEDYARKENILIISKVPDNVKIAKAYSKGELILDALPEYKKAFEPILELVKGMSR